MRCDTRRVRLRLAAPLLLACAPAAPLAAPAPAGPRESTENEDSRPEARPPSASGPALPPADAPAPLRPAAGVRLAYEARGWDILAAPERVIVLDQDFLHLRALDPASGVELWRAKVQERASGRQSLHALGDRVLFHAGPDLIVVELRTGRVLGSRRAGGTNGEGGCRVRRVRGLHEAPWREHIAWDPGTTACAIACDCSVQVFGCDDGEVLGERHHGTVSHLYHSLAKPHDSFCFTPPTLLGKVRGRTLLALDEGGAYQAAALDARGRLLWRRPELGDAVGQHVEVDGDPARDLCWSVADERTVAWTCTTGQSAWQLPAAPGAEPARVRVDQVDGDRLLVQRRGAQRNLVELRSLARGALVWSRALAADRIVLPPGDPPDSNWDGPSVYARLDLRTGATEAEIEVPARERLWREPTGGYLRVGGPVLVEYDAQGRQVRAIAKDVSAASWRSAHFLVLRRDDGITVLQRPALGEVLHATGSFSVVESSSALGPRALLLQEHRGDQPLRFAALFAE